MRFTLWLFAREVLTVQFGDNEVAADDEEPEADADLGSTTCTPVDVGFVQTTVAG